MTFYLVEIVDRDEYVLYDPERKGTARCRQATVKQLVSRGVWIRGVTWDKVHNTWDFKEVTTEGVLRTDKAENTCNDMMRHSTTVLMRGIKYRATPRPRASKKFK